MTCYICGKKSIDNVCKPCQKVHGISITAELPSDFEDEPTNPGFDLSDFEDKDFAADENGAVINTERWTLLEALYDECRTIRENLASTKGGYFVSDRELTDFFIILDTLENL